MYNQGISGGSRINAVSQSAGSFDDGGERRMRGPAVEIGAVDRLGVRTEQAQQERRQRKQLTNRDGAEGDQRPPPASQSLVRLAGTAAAHHLERPDHDQSRDCELQDHQRPRMHGTERQRREDQQRDHAGVHDGIAAAAEALAIESHHARTIFSRPWTTLRVALRVSITNRLDATMKS